MTSSSVEKISAKPARNSSDKKYLAELYLIMKSNCTYKAVQEPVCFLFSLHRSSNRIKKIKKT